MSQYWFKPIKFGYGAYPITWQGWIVTLFLVSYCIMLYIALPTIINIIMSKSFGVLMILILALSFFKTTLIDKIDGGLKWRWGKK